MLGLLSRSLRKVGQVPLADSWEPLVPLQKAGCAVGETSEGPPEISCAEGEVLLLHGQKRDALPPSTLTERSAQPGLQLKVLNA